MNKSGYGYNDGPQDGGAHRDSADSTQYLLKTERQILQLISARAPIPKILNEICYALDCQIGNMVSVVSLPDEEPNVAEIGENAELFGLHVFFETDIAADGGEQLGTLEMYSTVSRRPSAHELQWIARAVCLAAIAVTCSVETPNNQGFHDQGERMMRGLASQHPDSLN